MRLLSHFERWKQLPTAPEDERITRHMDAGDEFRGSTELADALARLGILAIIERRQQISGSADKTADRHAFVLRSLKRPEEVETLRNVYGDSFILIGAYSPRGARVERLAAKIAASHSAVNSSAFRATAERLVERDLADESKSFGQRVSDTFALADFFVNVHDPARLHASIDRLVPWWTGQNRPVVDV